VLSIAATPFAPKTFSRYSVSTGSHRSEGRSNGATTRVQRLWTSSERAINLPVPLYPCTPVPLYPKPGYSMSRQRLLQTILSPSVPIYSIGRARQPDATDPGVQTPEVLCMSIDGLNDWVRFLKEHLRSRYQNPGSLLIPHVSASDSGRKRRLSR